MTTSRQKCALLVVDGLGDLPIAEFGGRTPLEAARTPVLDRLAASGLYGLVDPIIPGEIPNTHSGAGMLLGMLPEQAERLKRGPVEASGAGRVLQPGEIAVRVNFATLQVQDDDLLVIDRRAGRIRSGTEELAALFLDEDLGDGVKATFQSTDQHRGVLSLSGKGLDAAISDTDPGDVPLPVRVQRCRALKSEAELTAGKINYFVKEAHHRLRDHPINIARAEAGKLPANGLITRGAGAWFSLDNVLTGHGINAAVVAGCNTVKGLGRVLGFDTISDPRFTAEIDTDLHAKIETVVAAFRDHEMVFLHFKAPDICAHDRHPEAKRDLIERLDEAMEPLLAAGVIIAVAADHTTDSNSGFHTADPVPALLYDPLSRNPGSRSTVKFGEQACRDGNMQRQLSHEFLLRAIRTMGY